ncbi:MAG: site-specific integrase [Phycisphaerales bacterium]|nr:site-specific integrase [Phycisphaerales bacterium]
MVQNPVLLMRRPAPARARNRRLVGGEEARLLNALDSGGQDAKGRFLPGTRNPWIKPIVQLMIETAMRRGEILGMCWEHVDLKARTVFLPDTKNGDSRTVPLSPAAITIVANLPRSISGRIFPISANAFKKAFNRARTMAGIKDLRAHDLRHEAASRLAEHLDNILELSAVTGHRDVRMLKRYYHPDASKLADKIALSMNQKSADSWNAPRR